MREAVRIPAKYPSELSTGSSELKTMELVHLSELKAKSLSELKANSHQSVHQSYHQNIWLVSSAVSRF